MLQPKTLIDDGAVGEASLAEPDTDLQAPCHCILMNGFLPGHRAENFSTQPSSPSLYFHNQNVVP